MGIKENLEIINKKINELNKDAVLVVVTKNQPIEKIREVISLGVDNLGENRIQEAFQKFNIIGKMNNKITWHMIGHLQTNKVKNAVEVFDMIQSLDSLNLVEEINKRCKAMNKIMPVLVEINIANEPQKTGLKEEELLGFLKSINHFENINVQGLMAMAPFVEKENREKTRPYFKRVNLLFEKVKKESIPNIEMKYLSMGMTNDYEIALQEGSNMVRIGTGVFRE